MRPRLRSFLVARSGQLGLVALAIALAGCARKAPADRYGFITRLGTDTIAVEAVTRAGDRVSTDAVDRFPRVRQRHTEITLAPDGSVRHLTMDIVTPSEPPAGRRRHVNADVNEDSIIMTKRDAGSFLRWALADHGEPVMAHVPQTYSLYELYFAAGLRAIAARGPGGSDTAQFRQFYIDREFDRFGTHHGIVRRLGGDSAEITHDWLAGTGVATVDTAGRLLRYSGARTTYQVETTRLSDPPDVAAIGARFAVEEAKKGGVTQLSVRDTARGSIGAATLTVDYARPLARGRTLLGGVIPYDRVWRTGANAATQLTTTAPIAIGALHLAAGTYTLWTLPRRGSAELIVNAQTGQWGTEYDPAHDLGTTPLKIDAAEPPVDEFTITIRRDDARRGALMLTWGPFRWSAPIIVGG